jgi:hypothetical protein
MSSIFTNTNTFAFNSKQIRKAAVDTGVITASSNNHPPQGTPAANIAAVRAK